MIVVRRTLEELNAALAGAILETPFAKVSMAAFNRNVRREYSPVPSVVWALLPWSKLKMSAACRPRGKSSNSNHEHLFIACLV